MTIINTFNRHTAIVKADNDLGLVFGWASVSGVNGREFIDLQGDIVPQDEMLKASTEFMADARLARVMHQPGGIGEVLHSMPLTDQIKTAFNIRCPISGWMIAMKIHDPAVLEAVRAGRLSGFSIGGQYTAKEAA
jgi:hypothetical protein